LVFQAIRLIASLSPSTNVLTLSWRCGRMKVLQVVAILVAAAAPEAAATGQRSGSHSLDHRAEGHGHAAASVLLTADGGAVVQKRSLFRKDAAPVAVSSEPLAPSKASLLEKPMEATSEGAEKRDCLWETWQSWSDCSQTCGSGTSLRTRGIRQTKLGAGNDCEGMATERNTCNRDPCPVDCLLAEWGAWSDCSVSCGGPSSPGKKERTRGLRRKAQHGGLECEGFKWETRICNHLFHQSCPRDCQWGDWSPFGDCSASCGTNGGLRYRTRSIAQQLLHTGKECSGPAFETEACNKVPCTLDCEWHDWQDWSTCSTSCGAGERLRIRDMKSAQNELGSCPGKHQQLARCFTKECPIDCEWTHYGDWGSCSAVCGGGERTKIRKMIPERFGGKPCHAEDNNVTEPCNLAECES